MFKLTTTGRQIWAVKCYTTADPDRADRYRHITEELARRPANWTVDCAYHARGIKGWDGNWWPVLLMPWVGGVPLLTWLGSNADNSLAVERCRRDFAVTIHNMHKRQIAHGDLQPGNVIVEAGDRLRLIDYDGMYVPGLDHLPLRQSGMPGFQHPGWAAAGKLCAFMDRFPGRLIHLSLLAIAREPIVWQELHVDGSDSLLLEADDLKKPETSERIKRLRRVADPDVQEELAQLCADLREPDDFHSIPVLSKRFRKPPADAGLPPILPEVSPVAPEVAAPITVTIPAPAPAPVTGRVPASWVYRSTTPERKETVVRTWQLETQSPFRRRLRVIALTSALIVGLLVCLLITIIYVA
ncbi:hypothetical protein J5X84_30435 [Streptosporangiaceae bacterium NEAU-GS5]|nr:hypothetical protein [Streptosporangiaceae bacterium NEAU-GS5]